jgi:hypothetical protein
MLVCLPITFCKIFCFSKQLLVVNYCDVDLLDDNMNVTNNKTGTVGR